MATALTTEQSAELEAAFRKAETGEQFAEVCRREKEMLDALQAAAGYLMNAAIDLDTGAPKKTALATINGGLKVVQAAIANARGAA